jgi:myo-inositol-1(or 4)-monophosphatase
LDFLFILPFTAPMSTSTTPASETMLKEVSRIAREAGKLLREQFGKVQQINVAEQRDIKLQIDVDAQRLIQKELSRSFPDCSIVGEEESHGDPKAEKRWIVDPLDGTVNYTYAIPHFAVSIALQQKNPNYRLSKVLDGYESILGVIYDPMRDELFAAERGKGATWNGRPARVSDRSRLNEAILSVGFSKSEETMLKGTEVYMKLIRQVRKMRTMGSAALDMAYISTARLDAYYEFMVRLWDVAAGLIIIEEAGGRVDLELVAGQPHTYKTLAYNGKVDLGVG